MTTFRSVTVCGQDEDGERYEEILVVPDTTTAEQLLVDPENAEVVCECFSADWAELVAQLLTTFHAKLEMH